MGVTRPEFLMIFSQATNRRDIQELHVIPDKKSLRFISLSRGQPTYLQHRRKRNLHRRRVIRVSVLHSPSPLNAIPRKELSVILIFADTPPPVFCYVLQIRDLQRSVVYVLQLKDLSAKFTKIANITPTPTLVSDVCANKGLTAIWRACVCK